MLIFKEKTIRICLLYIDTTLLLFPTYHIDSNGKYWFLSSLGSGQGSYSQSPSFNVTTFPWNHWGVSIRTWQCNNIIQILDSEKPVDISKIYLFNLPWIQSIFQCYFTYLRYCGCLFSCFRQFISSIYHKGCSIQSSFKLNNKHIIYINKSFRTITCIDKLNFSSIFPNSVRIKIQFVTSQMAKNQLFNIENMLYVAEYHFL